MKKLTLSLLTLISLTSSAFARIEWSCLQAYDKEGATQEFIVVKRYSSDYTDLVYFGRSAGTYTELEYCEDAIQEPDLLIFSELPASGMISSRMDCYYESLTGLTYLAKTIINTNTGLVHRILSAKGTFENTEQCQSKL